MASDELLANDVWFPWGMMFIPDGLAFSEGALTLSHYRGRGRTRRWALRGRWRNSALGCWRLTA